jgi:hypothetical protein
MRKAVQRGYEALHTVLELEHLLRLPLIWDNLEARQEVLIERDEAISLLSRALGILNLSGINIGTGNNNNGGSNELALDGGLAAALLQTAKGKKLMIRGFLLLPPEKRLYILNHIN